MARGVVSLTTHAARAPHVEPVVESLVRQGGKAGLLVILSIQKDVYGLLPESVIRMGRNGTIHIHCEDRDFGSNMKYMPAMMAGITRETKA